MEIEKEKLDKLWKVRGLLWEAPYDRVLARFFDVDSLEMLDEKIEVLTDLKNGKKPMDIPNYYKVLENYPTNKKDEFGRVRHEDWD